MKKLTSLIFIIVAICIISTVGSGCKSGNKSQMNDSIFTDSIQNVIEEKKEIDSVISNESSNQQLDEKYINLISEKDASQYYLSDITGDGFPELFIKSFLDASYYTRVYTIHNDSTMILMGVGGGIVEGDYIKEYIGKNYFLELAYGDYYCVWRKFEFKNYEDGMPEEIVYKNYLEDDKNFYKEPSDLLIAWKSVSEINSERVSDAKNCDKESDLSWLQGHWVYRQGSYEAHLVIKENTVRQYSSLNSESTYYTFRVDGNTMYIKPIKNDGTDFFVTLDYQNHRIDYGDGNWMRKI